MLGAESYGLIALFLSLKAISIVFDFGLAIATNREVAFRLGSKSQPIGSLIMTVERLYWVIGIAVSFLVWFLLHTYLVDWVSIKKLTSDQLLMMSFLFSISLGISWPITLYKNLLRGFGEHVTYNVALISSATFRNLGTLLVLWMFASSIEVFMYWYLIVSVMEIIMYWILVKRKVALLSDILLDRYDFGSLFRMKKFALGTGFSSIIVIIIYQADKILISKLLDLELLGYYSAILAIVGAFGKLTTPIVTAVFPRLVSIYGVGDINGVAKVYRHYATVIVNLLVPIVVAFIAFSPKILELWLSSSEIANDLQYVFIFLSIAYMFYSSTNMSIIVQMVYKNIKLLIISRVVALILLIPFLMVLITKYGLEGASIGVLVCSVFLYIILTTSATRKIFPKFKLNEPYLLVGPLLVSTPIFYLLQRSMVMWEKDSLAWLPIVVLGLIVSYLIIFRSSLLKMKIKNSNA
jgi:O-antigen/teichoic acid export membrane protein